MMTTNALVLVWIIFYVHKTGSKYHTFDADQRWRLLLIKNLVSEIKVHSENGKRLKNKITWFLINSSAKKNQKKPKLFLFTLVLFTRAITCTVFAINGVFCLKVLFFIATLSANFYIHLLTLPRGSNYQKLIWHVNVDFGLRVIAVIVILTEALSFKTHFDPL